MHEPRENSTIPRLPSGLAMNPNKIPVTRETLLQRVSRQRDDHAWQEFVDGYKGYIQSIAARMGLHHHDAEEVVQNVLLQLWKKLPAFEYDSRKGRFRAWLCTVTANEVKMLLRRKASSSPSQDEIAELGRAMEATQTDDFAEREWARYVTARAWSLVEAQLGEKEKSAFEMVSRGMSVEEVGAALGIATSSVYVYKKRVRDLLKKKIIDLNRELD